MTKIIENLQFRQNVEFVYSFIREHDYGYSISWDELRDILHEPNCPKAKLYAIINKVNLKLMLNDQKYLDTIQRFGKRIIMPQEHSEISRKNVKKAVKQYRKAGAIIASTNIDNLNLYQRQQIESDAMKWRTLELIGSELAKRKQLKKGEDIKEDLVTDVIKLFSKS